MNPHIFREYDIRGVPGTDMNDSDIVLIGKGAGTYLQRHGRTKIIVGRDCRLTSDRYRDLLVEGLLSTGCDVVDIGVCPTPVLYFSIRHLSGEGGVMITASHNPPQYNGFKLCKDGESLVGSEIQVIKQIIDKGDFAQGNGSIDTANVIEAYTSCVLGNIVVNNITLQRPLRVGVDAGNGTAGVIAVPIMKALGCEVFDIYCDMDGRFPNHESDPTVQENMEDLISLVRENGLDVGIGYDGDGDRLGVVDENGTIRWGDELMVLFSREILSRKPGATFVSEVKCSQTLYDDVTARGGKAIMWKTGHSLIKRKMKEVHAELAGEMSGHIFFADRYYGFDDGIYASCRLLEILCSSSSTLSERLADLPKTYTTPEIRVDCTDDAKFNVVEDVGAHFRKTHKIIDIDGVRILFENGWGLVRASNTQPVLVVRFEALSENELASIRSEIEAVLNSVIAKHLSPKI